MFKTSNFTYFPAPSWGATVKVWLSNELYLHAGAYEVNPRRKDARATGLDWGLDGATGTVVPFELGYSIVSSVDRLPRHYRVGGWYDSGDYSDPLRDDTGGFAVLSGRPGAIRSGRSGVFVQFEQTVAQAPTDPERALALFGVALTSTSGRVTEDGFLELGVVQRWRAAHGYDTLGLVVNDQKLSAAALENIRIARTSGGGSPAIARHETTIELAYATQLTSYARIFPNLQYIMHPDQMSEPFRTRDIPDALVIGIKLTLDTNALLE